MARVRVSTVVPAPPAAVWEELSDIRRHVEWMADAAEIRFTTTRRHGVGTAFDCVTRVGPITLVDRMVCTEWDPGRAIGIQHEGLVTGSGRMTLEPAAEGGTVVTWDEELRFPVRLGGPLGAAVGTRLVLRPLWRGNLDRLRRRCVATPPSSPRAAPPPRPREPRR